MVDDNLYINQNQDKLNGSVDSSHKITGIKNRKLKHLRVSTDYYLVDQKMMVKGLNTSTLPSNLNMAMTSQHMKKAKMPETPNKFHDISSIGKSLMEKNTAIDNTTN